MTRRTAEPVTASRWLEYMPLNVLIDRQDSRNPKAHADDDISRAMERFGYTEPVLLDERTGLLVAGHGRVTNLNRKRQTGEDLPDGIEDRGDDWYVPVNRGWRSSDDDEAGAYLVAGNRLTIKGGWHTDPLVSMLTELTETEQQLEGTGYTFADLDLLVSELSAGVEQDPYDEWAGMPDYENTDMKGKHRLIVHFKTEDDERSFLDHVGNPTVRQRSFWWPNDDGHIGHTWAEQFVADEDENGVVEGGGDAA